MRYLRLLALLLPALALMTSPSTARASHNDFRYKWPWDWSASLSAINTMPYSENHGCFGAPGAVWPFECVAAYDLRISDSRVMTAAEGVVVNLNSSETHCGSGLGFGNFVEAGGVIYAHLAVLAPSIAMGTTLLQGDGVGTEGATGNVLPCLTPDDQSGKHLHWQIGGQGDPVPPVIDGTATAPLTVASRPPVV